MVHLERAKAHHWVPASSRIARSLRALGADCKGPLIVGFGEQSAIRPIAIAHKAYC